MDSFEVEAKRTWFTLREIIGNAIHGGNLWTPATVTINQDLVRVATSRGSLELRPRRLVWTAPDSFRVTGLSREMAFCRSSLRFKTPEQASRAASIIRGSSHVQEEPLVPVKEFPVQVRLLVTGRYVILQLYVLFWRMFVGLFIFVVALDIFRTFGLVIGAIVFVTYVGGPAWAMFVKAKRKTQGWLRFQGRSIVVRTSTDWTPIIPKIIEWKSAQVIVLSGRGTKYELTFLSAQDLTQSVIRIRTVFPQAQEILAETYEQDLR